MKDADLISIIYLFLIPPYVVVIMLLFWKRRKTFPLAPRAPLLSLVFQFHILMVGLMGPSIILSDYAVPCYWYHWMWNIWNVLGVTTPTALRFVTFHWFCKMTQELEEHQVEPSITISHKSENNKDNNSRNNNPNQTNNNNNVSGGTAQNSEPSSKADTHQIALSLRRENTQEFMFTGGMETKEHVLNISRSGHNDRQSRNSTPSLSNRRPSVSLVSNPSTIHNNNNNTNPITGWYTTHRHWISPKMLTLLLLSGYLWVFPLGYIFNAIYPNITKATMLYDAECPLMSPFNMIIFGPVCASIVVLGFLTRELAEGIFLRREFMIGGILGILPAFINLAPFAQSRTFEILCWIFIVPFIETVFGTYPVYLSFCYSNHQKQVEAAKRRELENSRKETIESVKLVDVIRNEKGFLSYEKFLAKEFAAENLFFWRDVVKLEEFIDTENEKRNILIEKIRRDEERGREKKNILSQEFLEPGEQGLDFDDEPPTPLSTSAVYSSSDGAIMFTSTTTTPLTGTSTGSGQFTSSSTTSSVESSPAFTYNSIVTRPLLLPSASSSSLVTTPNSSPIISFTSLTSSSSPNFLPAKLSSSIELPNIIPAKNSPSSSSRQQQLPNIIPSTPSSTSRQHQPFPNVIPSKNSPSSTSRQHQPFPNIIPSKNSPSSISRQQQQQLPTLTPSSSHASSSSSAHEILPSSFPELPPPLEKSSPTSTSYYSGFPAISSPSNELTSQGPSTSSNSSSSSFPSSTIPFSLPSSSGIIPSSSVELSTQNNPNISSSSLSESPFDQKTFHSVIPTHTNTTTPPPPTTTHPSIPISASSSALVSSTNNNNNNNTNNDVSFTRSPSNYLPSSPSSSTSWNHNPPENPEVTELMGEKTVVISSTIIRKQKLGRKGLVKIKRTAKRIYATYLAPEAPYQVNVPGELRVQLLVNMVKLNKDHQWDNYFLTRPLFEDIKNEVLALMDNDSFQRYKISSEFREYYQSLIHSGPGYEHA